MKTEIEKKYQIFLENKSVLTDSRKVKKGDMFFALSGENFNGNTFVKSALERGARLVVVDDKEIFTAIQKEIESKQVNNCLYDTGNIILVENSLQALQDLAKRYRQDLDIPFLGITGSNGKTTTKELVRDVLAQKYNVLATEGNLNNHIGVPLTILSIKPEHNFAIVEMGANHVHEIAILADIAKPDFGIITNIGLAHVGEFGSYENIRKTKKELYDEVWKNKGKIFVNPDDEVLAKCSADFSEEDKVLYKKGEVLESDNLLKVLVDGQQIQTQMVGEYNLFNIQAVVTVGDFFGVEKEKIVQALESYVPNNNRSQIEKTKKGNEVIWDCYNANPSSMKLAIDSFSEKKTEKNKVYILGIMAELGEYSEDEHRKALEQLSDLPGKKILVGREFKNLEKEFLEYNFFVDVEELIGGALTNNLKNKTILVKGSNSVNLSRIKESL